MQELAIFDIFLMVVTVAVLLGAPIYLGDQSLTGSTVRRIRKKPFFLVLTIIIISLISL